MPTTLSYGRDAMRLAATLPELDRTIILIRHSERPSFDNIPFEEWDRVGLTPKGIEAAKEFGTALATGVQASQLRLHSWGLKRCTDTAEAIVTGAAEAGVRVSGRGPISFRSPIANRAEYEIAQRSGQWEEFITGWLASRPTQNGMVPIREYAPVIIRELLSPELCGFGEATLIATHDLHILPLASYLFEIPIRNVGYLEGIVIKTNTERAHFGFGKLVKSAEHSQILR
jgi:hypothetical protein